MVIRNDHIIMSAIWYKNLYQLRFKIPQNQLYKAKGLIARNRQITPEIIHQRLAHIGNEYIENTLLNTEGISAIETTVSTPCESCLKAKLHRNRGQNSISNSTRPIELIHTDISGPYTPSINHKRYYISYIDDYTRSI